MKPKLTNNDFCRSSKRLKCAPAAVKAVSFVESRGEGFYSDGFPVILFERHIFRKYTQGRYNRTHPHLSGPAGNYGAAGQNQRNKFNEAFALNPDAAMKSCSWGKFQIMGFNHAVCGFSLVGAFVDAMKESEGRQLDAFTSFVIANRLGQHLRNLDWASFAKGYNGAGYRKNAYDTKMATAYARFARENIDCSGSAATSTATSVAQTSTTNTATTLATPPLESPPIDSVTVTAPEPYQGQGFIAVIKKDFAFATGGNLTFQGLSEYAQQASGWPEWLIAILTKVALVAVVLTIGWFLFRVVHYLVDSWKKDRKVQTEAAANTSKDRFNIEWS